MCAFYLSDVSRGREPNHRLAFGGCLQTLAFFRATHFFCHCKALPIMGSPKDTLYFWGKGANKKKSERYRSR